MYLDFHSPNQPRSDTHIVNQDQLGTSLGHLSYLQVAAPKLLFASLGGKNENVIVRKVTVVEYQDQASKK